MTEIQLSSNAQLFPVTGEDVGPMLDKAIKSIGEMGQSFKVWNRSHSDLAWNAMVLSEQSDTRNLSQVSAEIKSKRNAITEAYFAYKKNIQQAKIFEDQALNESNNLEREMCVIEAQEQRSLAEMKHEGFMGACKDVEALKSSYDKIMARIIEKHGKFDESIFELEEKEYWIKRGFCQSMQDVRVNGVISKGEQILLEQIGIEPVDAESDIRIYLNAMREAVNGGNTIASGAKADFLKLMVDKHMPKVEGVLALMGDATEHLFIEEGKNDS